jgi:hypothetical protein
MKRGAANVREECSSNAKNNYCWEPLAAPIPDRL